MKMLIQIVVVALVVGGLSAAGSLYLLQRAEKTSSEAAATEVASDQPTTHDASTPNEGTDDGSDHVAEASPVVVKVELSPSVADSEQMILEPPAGVRPPFSPDSDEAGLLINELRARAASTSNQERQLFERQEALQLIFDDLRVEQLNSSQIRQRILDATNHSMRVVDEARRATETERSAIRESQNEVLRKTDEQFQTLRREKEMAVQGAEDAMKAARSEQEELRKQLEDLRKPPDIRDRSGSPEQNGNLKKMATLLDGMSPENSANILQQLVKSRRIEAVVVLLNAMKPRLSSKVLSTITEADPVLAANLTERLKRFKLEGETPAESTK